MGEELGVGVEGVISLWAEAESRSKSRARATSKSKAADPSATLRAGRSVRSTRAEAESKSRAAGESPASTQANSTQANSTLANSTQAELKLSPKQLGEIAEAEFIAKAVSEGFVVAKPWGDSESYDFIVNVRKKFHFWRVQVKSAHGVGKDLTYSFRAHDHEQKSYTAEDIDALVAYAKPEEAWYVFPVRVVEGLKSLKLYPGSRRKRSKYEKWREKWEIFRRAVRRRRR